MLGYLRPEKLRVGIVLESSELVSSPKVQSPHRPLRFHFDHRPRLGVPRCFALLRAASRCFALRADLRPGDCMLFQGELF